MNSASRLLHMYDQLVRQQKDQSIMLTWANVFGLESNDPHLEDKVISCLVALRQQIDFARTRLTEHEVPPELTRPGFDRLKAIASPSQLGASWNGQRGNIQSPECRHAFAWGAWVLRSEDEVSMTDDDFSELQSELNSLEKSLTDTEMPPYLRDFIQRQIDTIREALGMYVIQGSRPLQEALQKVAGAYTVERTRVESEHAQASDEAKGVLAKASTVIKKTAEVCDSLDKIKKFGEGAYGLLTTVGPLVLPYIDKVMK